MKTSPNTLRIGIAAAIIIGTIGWLAWSGYGASKSYYVTIAELGGMGDKAYHSQLRVEGFVQPGSIEHNGPHVDRSEEHTSELQSLPPRRSTDLLRHHRRARRHGRQGLPQPVARGGIRPARLHRTQRPARGQIGRAHV